MIEIIPDPGFDDADQWSITQSNFPLPSRTQITGGKLISGQIATPPTLVLGNGITRPIDYFESVYSTFVGANAKYSINVIELYASAMAEIRFGNKVLWDKSDGIGTFSGEFVTNGSGGLQLKGIDSGFIIESISIMADSIRELILQSLATQLKNITTANGYDFNISATSVARARRKFFDTDLPAIGVFDGEETQTSDYNDTRAAMLVRVEMHADAGETNRSTVMNQMMANLEKAILIQDTTHSGIAGGTVIDSIEQRLPDDDDSTLVTVVAVIRITYHKITGNPYSNP